MLKIRNEEHYYSLPCVERQHNRMHRPVNMIYKTLIEKAEYRPFTPGMLKVWMLEMWGVDLGYPSISDALGKLVGLGCVSRVESDRGRLYQWYGI